MKLYGLIGFPLGHSFSKQYFTEKFEREGLSDCFFEIFPIKTINDFEALIQANPSLKGLGVTIPYKEQVLQYVSELSEEVRSIGASNSIKVVGSKLIAYNTDIIGFEQSFTPLLKPIHNKALVLGTGGASKAVQYILNKLGIKFKVVTRSAPVNNASINYIDIDKLVMEEYRIIINCTPVGMWPNENTVPELPYHLLSSEHYLYDLVYKPEKTLFLLKGEEMGAIVKNGNDMLLIQAEASWKIWNSV